jgi:hypothetical protein
LFMGCSLLSIIEIFYYLFGGIFSSMCRRKTRKTTPIIQVQPTWANNSVQKPNNFQLSNYDIVYAINAMTRTMHDIEMRSIKSNLELEKRLRKEMESIRESIRVGRINGWHRNEAVVSGTRRRRSVELNQIRENDVYEPNAETIEVEDL